MSNTTPANPINARFLAVLFIAVFIIVGIPVGILVSKSQQVLNENTGDEDIVVGPTIYEEETADEFGCKTTCTDECKRVDNCPGEGRQLGHCGWTKTKPVIEKKWCRLCAEACPTLEPTIPLEIE